MLSSKDARILKVDLDLLFSAKAIVVPKSAEEWKAHGFGILHPAVEVEKHHRLPMTKAAIKARARVSTTYFKAFELQSSCTEEEVRAAVHSCYESWLQRRQQPDIKEFSGDVLERLKSKIKDFCFLVPIVGLTLTDISIVSLGPSAVHVASEELLQGVDLVGGVAPEKVLPHLKSNLWLISSASGSPKFALERFRIQASFATGVLAICAAVLHPGGMRHSHIHTEMTAYDGRSLTKFLRWERGGKNPQITISGNTYESLPLSAEKLEYLNETCFLSQLARIIGLTSPTEIERTLIRAVLCFAEAHSDQNTSLRFVKLWSCIECFFSISGQEITEANARGVASVLIFAGYNIFSSDEYIDTKRKFKRYYGLRSMVVHQAEFNEISLADLDDLSHLTAWLIVAVTSLSQRGYQNLEKLQQEAARLDALSLQAAHTVAKTK